MAWLTEQAEQITGRRLIRAKPPYTRLISAVQRIDAELATAAIQAVVVAGYEPRSVSYFVKVLEEAAAKQQTPLGGTSRLKAAELIDFAARLEARGA